jgi:hypothetical protein
MGVVHDDHEGRARQLIGAFRRDRNPVRHEPQGEAGVTLAEILGEGVEQLRLADASARSNEGDPMAIIQDELVQDINLILSSDETESVIEDVPRIEEPLEEIIGREEGCQSRETQELAPPMPTEMILDKTTSRFGVG